jgi:COMPASS component SWD1
MHPKFSDTFCVITQQHTPTLMIKSQNEWTRSSLVPPEKYANLLASSVTFAPNGNHIFVGTNKGTILVYSTQTQEFEFEYKVGTSLIKQLYFSRSGRDMIVNSNDRMVRNFAIDFTTFPIEISPLLKFFDSIDRPQWTESCISADGEYIVGATSGQHKHKIYIWDKVTGVLVKMLQGPAEGLTDMVWHPTRPMIASVSSFSGNIFLWQTIPTQKYSAYDPSK